MHQGNQPHKVAYRRRVVQACKPCSLSKVRCDGQRPCQRCDNHGIECYYQQPQKRRVMDVPTDESTPKRRSKETYQPSRSHGDTGINMDELASPATHITTMVKQNEAITQSESLADPAVSDSLQPSFAETIETIENDQIFSDLRSFMNLESDVDIIGFDSSLDIFNDIYLGSGGQQEPLLYSLPAIASGQSPTAFLTSSSIAEIYSRNCSPPLEAESVEPRQYHPTSIDVDAQLTFPDFSHLGASDLEQENITHVDDVPTSVVENIARLANTMERSPFFPAFTDVRIPPTPVLSVWVQLYFEHFHPVFPMLHKPSFCSPRTHWLIVFVVAAIGAQFSRLPNAQTCSRAMHEMVRRQTAYLVQITLD